MSIYVFSTSNNPDGSKRLARGTYVEHLTSLERGLDDASAAVATFLDACYKVMGVKRETSVAGVEPSNNVGLQAFDAHVADCGCQFRGQIVLALVKQFSSHGDAAASGRRALADLLDAVMKAKGKIENIRNSMKEWLVNPRQKAALFPKLSPNSMTIHSFQATLELQVIPDDAEYMLGSELIPTMSIYTAAKFLTFAYVLRKHMAIELKNGVLMGRLTIDADPVLDNKRVRHEFKHMQQHVSSVSMAYLKHLAKNADADYDGKSNLEMLKSVFLAATLYQKLLTLHLCAHYNLGWSPEL
ncbi:hypothetical protein BC832DRAFT_393932 [Gaertneriomyces semiglobifer]|nr:hypothetical protein BC832DRAFT_393932 [Gaertneriomyces semiglobifer]